MRKKILKLGLSALLVTNGFMLHGLMPATGELAFAADAPQLTKKSEAMKVKGKITNISQKAKTIAVSNKKTKFFLLKFTDDTNLKGVKSTRDFKVGEAIIAHYSVVNGENIAGSLEKALVKLPAGVKEVKTAKLFEMMNSKKKLVVIDARPPVKYAEGHIPGSLSIPYAKLLKKGADGAKLLEKYKDRQLVFYCGGAT